MAYKPSPAKLSSIGRALSKIAEKLKDYTDTPKPKPITKKATPKRVGKKSVVQMKKASPAKAGKAKASPTKKGKVVVKAGKKVAKAAKKKMAKKKK
tara:strand:+ start:721 stop:1008 length:288 start_codon:yes stop_codon:yes gene_type:complete